MHCVTPRDSIDVGLLALEGFASGPIERRHNRGQHGACTRDGAGDGKLEPGTISFEPLHTFDGDGLASFGLGLFTGRVTIPPARALTASALVDVPGLRGSSTTRSSQRSFST